MPRRAIPTCLVILLIGCSNQAEPRAQVLLVVDTDAPVAAALADDPFVSPDAAMDTLRIDLIDPDTGSVSQPEAFAVASSADWPVSFGIVPPADGAIARLRLRLFRASNAHVASVGGEPVLEPTPGVAIDRLVDLEFPSDGIARLRVLLAFECIGVSATFGKAASTCVDADRQSVDPRTGIEAVGESGARASRVGKSELAREVECSGAPDGAICVPGGFAFLGDLDLFGVGNISEDARPLRPIVISPFALDRTERTVGQIRQLILAHPEIPEPTQDDGNPLNVDCIWKGVNDSSVDEYPINCVSVETARLSCEAWGGSLPTEARWEFAARGRGRRYTFPWGTPDIGCCVASHSRFTANAGSPPLCGSSETPEPIASHLPDPSCDGVGDVSIDGVVDLGGSMAELTEDRIADYSAPCWEVRGKLRDPICDAAEIVARVERGGSWTTGAAFMYAASRRIYTSRLGSGFRCAFEVQK